jgi:hypothetical protein
MWNHFVAAAVLGIPLGLVSASIAQAFQGERMYLVNLQERRVVESGGSTRLSPALVALKDSGGVLKGSDDRGRPVIAVSQAKVDALLKSRAVRSISDEGLPKEEALKKKVQLKLSYWSGKPPDKALLSELGLELVEDYEKGQFMIVKPLKGAVNADLAAKLEACPKIKYVTPLWNVKAIRESGSAAEAGRER